MLYVLYTWVPVLTPLGTFTNRGLAERTADSLGQKLDDYQLDTWHEDSGDKWRRGKFLIRAVQV